MHDLADQRVVPPDDREVVGHGEAHLLRDAETGDGEQVAVEDHCRRRAGRRQQPARRPGTALRACSPSTTTCASRPSSRTAPQKACRALVGVDELRDAGDARDPAMSERSQVLDRLDHDGRLVVPHRGQPTVAERAADHDGRKPELGRARRCAGRPDACRRRRRRRPGARRTSDGRPRSRRRRVRTSWIVSPIERAESWVSTPAMNSMKNGSSAIVVAGRASTSPSASAREAESARAARFGYHPSSFAIVRMRSRVSSETPGRPLSAYETAPFDTPGALRDVPDRRPARLLFAGLRLTRLSRPVRKGAAPLPGVD